jgi:TonB family protein
MRYGAPHVPGQTAFDLAVHHDNRYWGGAGRASRGRHATLKEGYGPRMSRRLTGRARRRGWALALGASLAGHALVLGPLLRASARGAAVAPELVAVELQPETPELRLAPFPAPAAEAVAPALPDPPLPARDEVVVARPLDAPMGDRDRALPRTVAPRVGDSVDRAAPAADQGAAGGHQPEPATRRDRSTLNSHLSDGGLVAQTARTRTASRAQPASPQAIRRELTVGVGDSPRSSDPSRAPSAKLADLPPAPGAADEAGPRSGNSVAARVDPRPDVARISERPAATRGVGPLAVDRGARLFDTEQRGRAADNQDVRAASPELHPGITDFSRPAAPSPTNSAQGRGPGSAPGAVAHASSGDAPGVYGARNPQQLGAELAARTRERQYDRYRQEVQRRIQNVLIFPKPMALRLEQGEAVVYFVVRSDGLLGEAPRVVKSSGFQEFDAEAVKAVLRAAPFPRRGDAAVVSLSMPVTFENPMVR